MTGAARLRASTPPRRGAWRAAGLEDLRPLAPTPDRTRERRAHLAEIDRVAARGRVDGRWSTRRAEDPGRDGPAYARHQYEPTWAGLNWGRSLGTTSDRLGLTLAAEDAAAAAVMGDLLDEDTSAALSEPFEHAAGMSGSTTTPSLSLAKPNRIGWLGLVPAAPPRGPRVQRYLVGSSGRRSSASA